MVAAWMNAAELVNDLAEAQAEHRLSRLAALVDRVHLLILDELGFVKLKVGNTPSASHAARA